MSPPRKGGLAYRRGVGMMVLNECNRVLVARRRDISAEAWQMPQGGIDRGETPRRAALRELGEEIGTDRAVIIGESRGWLSYDLPPDLVGKALRGPLSRPTPEMVRPCASRAVSAISTSPALTSNSPTGNGSPSRSCPTS